MVNCAIQILILQYLLMTSNNVKTNFNQVCWVKSMINTMIHYNSYLNIYYSLIDK